MSKYGDLIKQARKPVNQKTGKPEKQIIEDKEVNLSIKVFRTPASSLGFSSQTPRDIIDGCYS